MLAQASYGGTKDHALHGIPHVRMRLISGVDRNSPRRCRRQTSHSFGATANADVLSPWHASLEPAIQAPTMHVVLLGLSQAIVVVAKMGAQTGPLEKGMLGRDRPSLLRRQNRAKASALLYPSPRPLRRTRCEGRAAHRDRRRHQRRLFLFREGSRVISQRKPGHPARAR